MFSLLYRTLPYLFSVRWDWSLNSVCWQRHFV